MLLQDIPFPETNKKLLKIGFPQRKFHLPTIDFRGYVSFRGSVHIFYILRVSLTAQGLPNPFMLPKQKQTIFSIRCWDPSLILRYALI